MRIPHDHDDFTLPSRNSTQIEKLIAELTGIRSDMLQLEADFADHVNRAHPSQRNSARNLLHYLALRQHDIRHLQESLTSLGLSSLGRTESHVMANLDAVMKILFHLARRPWQAPTENEPVLSFAEGKALLEAHTEALLGPRPANRNVRIMVTMPTSAADDYKLMRELLASGMNCMRVNCAHDNPEIWARMIANLRRAEQKLGKECLVFMDLGGPKLRTGTLEPGPQVIKWRPQRDSFGRVLAPARIWLTPLENIELPPAPADACLPVPGEWLAKLHAGDVIKFFDTREAARAMQIVGEVDANRWAESRQTAYVSTGTVLYFVSNQETDFTLAEKAQVGALPRADQFILLKKGDTLILTSDARPCRPAVHDEQGRQLKPARISITLPEIFADVRTGEMIWFDDGKIGGVIKSVKKDRIEVEITNARNKGERLRADKGINLPDSKLRLPALTQKDLEDLPFVVKHADLVGLSFVRNAEDVHALQSRLAELGGEHLGVVVKIETLKGFVQLPKLILAAMRSKRAGVLIARGDLAVECGYERLAEIQEEILWICEAAHMPVFWATQVLENLAQKGQPSRAEITDAAMAERAECVMLNKGPYIVEAVRVLDDILQRMQTHQRKKKPMLRKLKLAHLVKGE
ncbi:MAG: pyruvate kinase [candidate division KSB1 bacterium]|nr:pyruvate kinase [candidate division KSB1 bacterium]MDZ7302661.1 pyruvate kinase [candidate division KSB1 bacterium]MDZ7311809.1 pyruvate kinase [candidate division KSB1 bacterium]